MTGDFTALRVRITGRVQGVSFRDWTRQQATRLGLTGWVRNELDGSVSALIAGSGDAVATMLEYFWRGPRLASVSDVTTDAVTISEAPPDFRVTG